MPSGDSDWNSIEVWLSVVFRKGGSGGKRRLSFFFLFRVFPSTSDLDLEKFVAPLFAPLEGKN